MKRLICILFYIQFVALQMSGQTCIDRKALVERHRIVTTKTNNGSPAQVGNGEFAFGVDITGLQTFVPFNTMSNWGWHSTPLPKGVKAEDFRQSIIDTHGRQVLYDLSNPEQPKLSQWLAANPHRFNLGRIGLKLTRADGSEATQEDLSETCQEVDLWTGIISSHFKFEGNPVTVKTACHPNLDAIAVTVESPLVKKGKIAVFLAFPYANEQQQSNYVGTYDTPEKHRSTLKKLRNESACIIRKMDDVLYYTTLFWSTPASITSSKSPHRFELLPKETEKLSFTCLFSREKNTVLPLPDSVFSESKTAWNSFWKSGAAIDLSESKDPRWKELERRIVLSQYVMKINEAGTLPPQESGLVNNGWYGRFHFEMIWWHGVHYALWNRWSLWDKSLGIYRTFLNSSKQRAESQGYNGARWPKCTANFDREWPHLIHATLLWQEPHPIYFAELDYRLHPNKKTLEKWKEVVFATADFMADYAFYDKEKDKFVLGPPLYLVSENSDPRKTKNPAFELSYWRSGLRMAQKWRERLGLPPEKSWKNVLEKLAPLPVEKGVYVTYEEIPEMWKKYAFEHPGLIGTYGMLPGDGVDRATFSRTLIKVANEWNFNRTWGWDFPMLAMAAARSGNTGMAIDFLLHPSHNFRFDEHGLATGGPFPYFPSNGGLLTAVAMMAGGWDGSSGQAPGFPKDGSWAVRCEGFMPMPAYIEKW